MKQTPVYDIANDDLLSLVPADARRVVDVGCMLGSLARAIRRRSPETAVAARQCTKFEVSHSLPSIALYQAVLKTFSKLVLAGGPGAQTAEGDAIPFQYLFEGVAG